VAINRAPSENIALEQMRRHCTDVKVDSGPRDASPRTSRVEMLRSSRKGCTEWLWRKKIVLDPRRSASRDSFRVCNGW